MDNETYELLAARFNEDAQAFLCEEALKIYCQAEDKAIALDALMLLKSAVQM